MSDGTGHRGELDASGEISLLPSPAIRPAPRTISDRLAPTSCHEFPMEEGSR